MESKLDLILLEELTRKYGAVGPFTGHVTGAEKRSDSEVDSYRLDIDNGDSRLEINMLEVGKNTAGESKVIYLSLNTRRKPYDDYKRILDYRHAVDRFKKLTLFTGGGHRKRDYPKDAPKFYPAISCWWTCYGKESDSAFVELKYTNSVKIALDSLKKFAYDKEGFEKLIQ